MANPTINQYLANFKGGARPSLFSVSHPFPAAIGGGADVADSVTFFIKGAQLPGVNIGPIETFYMGRPVKIAGDRTFDEMTFTVLNDTDFKLRTKYEQWANLINRHSANTGETQPSEYMVDIVVNQLDRAGNIIKAYKLVGCFPSNIAPIDLAFDSVDTIEEFTCSVQFQYWTDVTNGIE